MVVDFDAKIPDICLFNRKGYSDEDRTRKLLAYYSARSPEYCFVHSQTLPAPGPIARSSGYWVQALPYHDAHCTCWARLATEHKQGVEMASRCAANIPLTRWTFDEVHNGMDINVDRR